MKYASVYKRDGSPRFSISYWSPKKQKRIHETTPFLIADPQGKRKALGLANERGKEAAADKSVKGTERWEKWAEGFLRERYKARPKTLARMLGAWKQWHTFLSEEQIRVPRGLDYNAVLRFIEWRRALKKPSGRFVTKNTALCDVRAMSVVMREAMRRNFAETNHCEKLGITKDPAKKKPEMTDGEIARIREALRTRPEWMRVSFEIAIHQGCRLSETSAPLSAIDFERNTITFAAKGRRGEKHIFTTQLHPALWPLLETLAQRKLELTCELPRMAAKEWHMFFREIKLDHLCFHCTRVTVITRMARAGVPISQAMAFVGHASETIHHIYQRLATSDLGRAVAAVSYGGDARLQNPGEHRAIAAPS